jgi:predicted transcriptional regulator
MIGRMIRAFGADDVAGWRYSFRKLRFQMIADTGPLDDRGNSVRGDMQSLGELIHSEAEIVHEFLNVFTRMNRRQPFGHGFLTPFSDSPQFRHRRRFPRASESRFCIPRRRDFSLDNLICQCSNIFVLDVEVIQSPQAAAAALDPVRARLLAELSEPASAATLAARLSLPRQKVNYHLRALESHHLVRPTSERKWGGITERLVEATASSYVVSPAAMGPAASDPGRSRDRLSAGYLIALAARVVREVSELATRARETGKRLATLSIDTEIRFRSAAERAQFSSELTAAITQLAARYHDASALGGRTHRLVLVAHPLPQKNKETAV